MVSGAHVLCYHWLSYEPCLVQAQQIRTRCIAHMDWVFKQVDFVATPATACTAPVMRYAHWGMFLWQQGRLLHTMASHLLELHLFVCLANNVLPLLTL